MKKEQTKDTRIISCPLEVLALVERFDQNLDQMLSLNKQLPTIKTDHEKTEIQR